MNTSLIVLPIYAHIAWIVLLYLLLTLVRMPVVWSINLNPTFTQACQKLEPKVSSNLSNQFEWPILFYTVCILWIATGTEIKPGICVVGMAIRARPHNPQCCANFLSITFVCAVLSL